VTRARASLLRRIGLLAAITVLAALMLQGCGRKGALAPPPGDEDENPAETNGGY
jgi:predicted small lipoprotein YifL